MEILLGALTIKQALGRFDTSAGNPVKEILLKLNLPDHKSILTDSKVTPTKHGQITKPYSSSCFIANCFNAGYLKMEVKSHTLVNVPASVTAETPSSDTTIPPPPSPIIQPDSTTTITIPTMTFPDIPNFSSLF
ncbi:hypothetical protein Tco_0478933 [Tanacetum coccineum]